MRSHSITIKSLGFVAAVLAAGQFGCGAGGGSEPPPSGSGGTSPAGSGGRSSSGGNTASGGAVGSGGTAASSGGAKGSGGSGSGGTVSSSGGSGTASSGGKTGSGGASSSGGTVGSAGHSGSGGAAGAGNGGPGGAISGGGGATSSGGTTGGGGAAAPSSENMGASCMVAAADLKKNMKLPNPFTMHDGTMITTMSQWECHRNEIRADLEKYEIGTKQAPPTVAATLSGSKLTVHVTVGSNSIDLTSTVSGSGSCLVIGMGSTTTLVSGCQQMAFSTDQVVKYDGSDSNQYQSDPFYKLYPSLWQKIGNYSAWAWGVSRLIDGVDQVKDQLKVDMTKIGTWGCSYAGKMSLFSGAFDERVALTIVEESGGGGINAWRTSDEYVKNGGMSIEKIDNTNFGWFLPSMKKLDPYSLPHDHHELIAMIAPRATIILGNDTYVWLGDESGYKSTMAALDVFTAMGVADHLGYDFTSNHNHCQAPTTQQNSVKTFVQRFLQGGTAATNIAIKPPTTSFDFNWQADVDWTPPLPALK